MSFDSIWADGETERVAGPAPSMGGLMERGTKRGREEKGGRRREKKVREEAGREQRKEEEK